VWPDSRHLHGILALILGVFAISKREALIGTSNAWSKSVKGSAGVLIGVVLLVIGIFLITAH
jgi:hypothetical protein